MPMYDRQCPACGWTKIDVLEPMLVTPPTCPTCGAATRRAWLTKPSNVVSDECDVLVEHGLCNPDGSARRFTSKSEMHREAARRGLVNHVVHRGSQGGDRSPHTTRWV